LDSDKISLRQKERINLELLLTNMKVGGTAWIRYETKKGTTFILVDRQADNWFRLSHEIEGINAGPCEKISKIINESKEIEKARLVKIDDEEEHIDRFILQSGNDFGIRITRQKLPLILHVKKREKDYRAGRRMILIFPPIRARVRSKQILSL
jgi:hypothetical protein